VLALLPWAILALTVSQVPRAPFVATPPDVVERMLTFAGVTSRDVVYDLGCGDGRIVITAAQKFGARGVGVDIDPVRVEEARRNAVTAGVAHLVTFRVADVFDTDVSDATVVTLYLLAAQNVALRPTLMRQLRPGARIVSHNFAMGDWEPHAVETFRSTDQQTRTLYLWRISPAPSPAR
jgi:tRNA A58 N-methylase Trm61